MTDEYLSVDQADLNLTYRRLVVSDFHPCSTPEELNRWRQAILDLIEAATLKGKADAYARQIIALAALAARCPTCDSPNAQYFHSGGAGCRDLWHQSTVEQAKHELQVVIDAAIGGAVDIDADMEPAIDALIAAARRSK